MLTFHSQNRPQLTWFTIPSASSVVILYGELSTETFLLKKKKEEMG